MQAAGKLQANQKPNHWYKIKPVQEKKNQYKFIKSALVFLLFKATTKIKHVCESFLGERLNRGCTKAEKQDLNVKENILHLGSWGN